MELLKNSFRLIKSIKSPKDLNNFSIESLYDLCSEIRTILISSVANHGGHLSSNLGVTELTVALHYVYNSPKDKLVWDVGHQGYVHKLLTGRFDRFETIRTKGGISGYLKIIESEHDAFGAGHAGTAVSAALGIAEANRLDKTNAETIAIFGDGALTNGLTYEGLNNAGDSDSNITLVLNDNQWSISKNIGAMTRHLAKISSQKASGSGESLAPIFQSLGFTYLGPVDGHDLKELIRVFERAKNISGPKLVHVNTKKGCGYPFSEQAPDKFHLSNPFDPESGECVPISKLTYSQAFGQALLKIAEKDQKVIAITAAMKDGTGLAKFAEKLPERFYDVGIAESHAVTFAAGMSTVGFKPVVAIYSAFMQRAYDEILHDVCLQNLPVVFALDRAGVVGSDGPTHHGLFDLSYLRNIPNLVIAVPKDENELGHMLNTGINSNSAFAIRYPRGAGENVEIDENLIDLPVGKAEKLSEGNDLAILAVGTMVYPAIRAVDILKREGVSATLYNARFVKPLDLEMVKEAGRIGKILTVEENVLDGGFGSAVLESLEMQNIGNVKVTRIGVEGFAGQGEIPELRQELGLTTESIVKKAKELAANNALT